MKMKKRRMTRIFWKKRTLKFLSMRKNIKSSMRSCEIELTCMNNIQIRWKFSSLVNILFSRCFREDGGDNRWTRLNFENRISRVVGYGIGENRKENREKLTIESNWMKLLLYSSVFLFAVVFFCSVINDPWRFSRGFWVLCVLCLPSESWRRGMEGKVC